MYPPIETYTVETKKENIWKTYDPYTVPSHLPTPFLHLPQTWSKTAPPQEDSQPAASLDCTRNAPGVELR